MRGNYAGLLTPLPGSNVSANCLCLTHRLLTALSWLSLPAGPSSTPLTPSRTTWAFTRYGSAKNVFSALLPSNYTPAIVSATLTQSEVEKAKRKRGTSLFIVITRHRKPPYSGLQSSQYIHIKHPEALYN